MSCTCECARRIKSSDDDNTHERQVGGGFAGEWNKWKLAALNKEDLDRWVAELTRYLGR